MMNEPMIQVEVDQLFSSNMGFVVLLKGRQDGRSLPIFIGAAEAQAIAIQIQGLTMPRPLTHDLLKNLLDFLECRLLRIEVCDLKDGTFFGRLVLDRDGSEMSLDCRPSDAIAIALRCGASIFVNGAVMDEAGRVIDKSEIAGEHPKMEKGHGPKGPPKKMSPKDTLTHELERAVTEERYEDAAKLRDEIKQIESPHSGN